MLLAATRPAQVSLLALLCAACAPTLNRYKSLAPGSATDTSVTVSIYTLPLPPPDPRTILNLTERGQAAAITALASATKTPGELLTALASPLEPSAPLSPVLDRTRVRRRLVIAVRHDTPWLADRVALLRVEVSPTDSLVRLVGWDKLTTRYETIDLGKSTVTSQASFTAGVGASRGSQVVEGGETATGSLAPSATATIGRTSVEESLLRQRYIAVSGELTDTSASVVLEGVPGIDLSGNTLADLDILLPRGNSWRVVTAIDDLKPDLPQTDQCTVTPTLRVTPLYLPKADNYTATMSIGYSVRRVVRGEETLKEGDDDIVIGRPPFHIVKTFTLVGKSDFAATFWYAFTPGSVVHMKHRTESVQLVFSSLGLGQQVTALLRKCGTSYFGAPLFQDAEMTKPLSDKEASSIRVDQWNPYEP